MKQEAWLSLRQIEKEYNFQPILRGITIDLLPGSIHLVTAPNGSGKTTLLHILAGLTRPSHGDVLWRGRRFDASARSRIGVVLQSPLVYGDLSGLENLVLYAGLYAVSKKRDSAKKWMENVGLQHAANQKVREYSKGMMQRLALARAMIHQPDVLLLDEPFDGLDAEGIHTAAELLQSLVMRGSAVFMALHQGQNFLPTHHHYTLQRGRLAVVG